VRLELTSRIRKLFGLETKASTLAAPDPFYLDLFGSYPALSGVTVTPQTAMTCAPVRRAVSLISESIGQLPIHVYERDGEDIKGRAANHPLDKLLTQAANDWTSASQLRESVTKDALLHPYGGFAYVVRANDKPVELVHVDREYEAVVMQYNYATREPVYSIPQKIGSARMIARQDLIHIPSPSYLQKGIVAEAKETIGLAIVMERYAARLFGNGARPSGVLSLKGQQTSDSLTKIKTAWNAAMGGDGNGGTAVLPSDATWQQLQFSSVDSQFLEMRRLAVDEVARVFSVPPHMLFEMGRATFRNSENMGQDFLTFSLMAWINRWEGELNLKLLSEEDRAKYVIKFNTDGFVRADMTARFAALTQAVRGPWMLPDEARQMDNRPPIAGGDKLRPPANASGIHVSSLNQTEAAA